MNTSANNDFVIVRLESDRATTQAIYANDASEAARTASLLETANPGQEWRRYVRLPDFSGSLGALEHDLAGRIEDAHVSLDSAGVPRGYTDLDGTSGSYDLDQRIELLSVNRDKLMMDIARIATERDRLARAMKKSNRNADARAAARRKK